MVINQPPHKTYLLAFLLIMGGRSLTEQVNKTTDVYSVEVEEQTLGEQYHLLKIQNCNDVSYELILS